MEDEIFVRIIAYKLDCKNCMQHSEAQFQFKSASMSPEHIGKKYIDQASFSIGNTILKLLGYLTEEDGRKG